METSFSAKVWNWYADDEYEKLLSFLQLCHGLAERGRIYLWHSGVGLK